MAANAQPENKRTDARPAKSSLKSRRASEPNYFWIGALIIFAVTLAVYLPAIQHAGFIWDDDGMLTQNEFIHAPDGLHSFWFTTKPVDYFPLTESSLWVEFRLWGMNPLGYHVVNLLLHVLSAIVFWRALKFLKIPGAFWAALIFAVHPINVESVMWIAERKNTLAMLFFALAFYFYLRFDHWKSTPNLSAVENSRVWPRDARMKWYCFSLLAFALALLSKTAVVMLPFALLICAWWQRNRITRTDFFRAVPFFILSLAMGLVTIWFQYNRAIGEISLHESDFWTRLAGAGWNVWFYLEKALLPIKLIFVYPHWEINSHALLSYLPGVGYLALLGVFWFFRESWGRPFLFALGFFVVMLFPVLGFFKIFFFRYSLVADHYQYFSIIAVIALVVGLVTHFFKNQAAYIFAALALVLGSATAQQCRIYKNQETLWTDTLQKNPGCWMAEGNWGYWFYSQEHYEEAISHYRAALKIKPDDVGSIHNLGVSLLYFGKKEEAIEKFRETVQHDPNHIDGLANLAWLLAIDRNSDQRTAEEAVQFARRAVALTKEKDDLKLDTLAAAEAAAGQFDNAVQTELKALQIARSFTKPDALPDMEKRLEFYKAKRPYREGD